MESKTTEIFYLVDEFCKEFYKAEEGHKRSLQKLQTSFYDSKIQSKSYLELLSISLLNSPYGSFVAYFINSFIYQYQHRSYHSHV